MTKKIMLINETHDESRIAILENNILQEMLIEHITEAQIKNNLYKGIVIKAQPSLQAAFVDFGYKKHGFLQNGEVNPRVLNSGGDYRRDSPIQEKLDGGQPLLVQVVKEAVDQKGAVLTTNVSLPGRFMVLMPYGNKGGISKKIEDPEERERLRSFISGINSDEESVIIRTAGMNRSLSELKKDYTALKKVWKEIKNSYEDKVKPGLIYREADAVVRTLRDYYTNDVQEIWIDNPETYQRALKFFKTIAPRRRKILKLFVSDYSLFSSYNIEKQVEQLTSRHVKLKSGGSIIIDQTEALVAIDVNSGKSNQEGNIQATALRTNLEAAEEIARQLRLRNLGGLVVADFIDMDTRSTNKKVEKRFQDAMKRDKAQYKTAPISEFGLMEISRQRLAIGISNTVESICPTCSGKGKIPSLLASTNLALRSIREMAAGRNLIRVEGRLPLEMANYLLNECRQFIADLELEFGVDVILKGDPELAVFDTKLLKPVFEDKHQAKQPPSAKKSSAKVPKRKHRQEEGERQTVKEGERQTVKEGERQTVKEGERQTVKEGERQTVKEGQNNKPAPASKDEEVPKPEHPEMPKESPESASDIHPSCLFPDIEELSEEEMVETLESFGRRLKGDLEEEPYRIDEKYLWNSVDEAEAGAESESDQGRQPPAPEAEARRQKEEKSEIPAKTASPKKRKTRTSPQKEAAKKAKPLDKKKSESNAVKKDEAPDKKKSGSKAAKKAKPPEKKKGEASSKFADKASKKKEAEKVGKNKSADKDRKDSKTTEKEKSESVQEKKSEASPKSADKAPRNRRKNRGGRKKNPESSETPEASEKAPAKASEKSEKKKPSKSIPAENANSFSTGTTEEEIENLAIQFIESIDENDGLDMGTDLEPPKDDEVVSNEVSVTEADEDSRATETGESEADQKDKNADETEKD